MPTRFVEKGAHRLARLPRAVKASIAIAADLAALPVLLLFALTLRWGTLAQARDVSPGLLLAMALCGVSIFGMLNMYRVVFRFLSRGSFRVGGLGVVLLAGMVGLVNHAFFAAEISLNAIAIFCALTLIYMLASRSMVRELLYYRRSVKERVLISDCSEAPLPASRYSVRMPGRAYPA
jgi:FlaA1/EpsC-like NDP-sugar epimerase